MNGGACWIDFLLIIITVPWQNLNYKGQVARFDIIHTLNTSSCLWATFYLDSPTEFYLKYMGHIGPLDMKECICQLQSGRYTLSYPRGRYVTLWSVRYVPFIHRERFQNQFVAIRLFPVIMLEKNQVNCTCSSNQVNIHWAKCLCFSESHHTHTHIK